MAEKRKTKTNTPMTSTERKRKERTLKRGAGLVDKLYWLLPEDVPKAEKLQEKALKTLDNESVAIESSIEVGNQE